MDCHQNRYGMSPIVIHWLPSRLLVPPSSAVVRRQSKAGKVSNMIARALCHLYGSDVIDPDVSSVPGEPPLGSVWSNRTRMNSTKFIFPQARSISGSGRGISNPGMSKTYIRPDGLTFVLSSNSTMSSLGSSQSRGQSTKGKNSCGAGLADVAFHDFSLRNRVISRNKGEEQRCQRNKGVRNR